MVKTWQLHDAPQTMARQQLPCMTVLKEYNNADCVAGCNGQWLLSARQPPKLTNDWISQDAKCLSELVVKTWQLHDAPQTMARQQLPCMTVLKEYNNADCVAGCNGQWLLSARQVLRQNKISAYVFASAVRDLLINGRRKI